MYHYIIPYCVTQQTAAVPLSSADAAPHEEVQGVNWVKDREDYLGLCSCQTLSLTHSIWGWPFGSSKAQSDWAQRGKEKGKPKGGKRGFSSLTQDFTGLWLKKAPFAGNQSKSEQRWKDDTGDCKLYGQLTLLLHLLLSHSGSLFFFSPTYKAETSDSLRGRVSHLRGAIRCSSW